MATAADVPQIFDVVINGNGYITLDAVESVLGRKTRASYAYSPTFIERQNVQGNYGDNTQDFWLTFSQKDWSLGEQQRFARPNDDEAARRYWRGTSANVRTPGRVTSRQDIRSLSFAAAVVALGVAPDVVYVTGSLYAATATNLYLVADDGTITDKGAHGLGAAPGPFGIVAEASHDLYLGADASFSVGVRKYDIAGAAYSTFSATKAHALEFLNNTLFGLSLSALVKYDTAGAATTIYTWKGADGAAQNSPSGRIRAFGGKLLILRTFGQKGPSELWIYDGTAPSLVAVLPENFWAYDLTIVNGIAIISGAFMKTAGAATAYLRPALFYLANGSLGLLWQADDFATSTSALTVSAPLGGPYVAAAAGFDGGLVFADGTTGKIMFYDPATGGVSSLASYTAGTGNPILAASGGYFLLAQNQTAANLYPHTSYPTSVTVTTALADFDSSLDKLMRGVKVDFDAASDGNGGTVDIAYRLNDVDGAYTTLQTGATSGSEYTLPAATTGRSISIKVTLNKGTSTSGPTLKRISGRAAPVQRTFKRREYILNLSGNPDRDPESMLVLRDGSLHSKSGKTMATDLITAITNATPITITDRFGSYTGIAEADQCEIDEIHPEEFAGRVVFREV